MFSDRFTGRVRVWLDHIAPPITSNGGKLDVKLHLLALQHLKFSSTSEKKNDHLVTVDLNPFDFKVLPLSTTFEAPR